MNLLYWPAFSRMAVMLMGPEGAGAGADWAAAEARREHRRERRMREEHDGAAIVVVVESVCVRVRVNDERECGMSGGFMGIRMWRLDFVGMSWLIKI